MGKYKRNPPTPPRSNTPVVNTRPVPAPSAPIAQPSLAESGIQTLAQKRAKHALAQVTAMPQDDEHIASQIAGFPAMILMSGFGQACAFYLSKGKSTNGLPMKLAYEALQSWLTSRDRPYSKHPRQLMCAITESDAATYRLAQAEALAYLDWLKKFAVAFLKRTDNEG